jgi:hypothetical protein
MEVLVLNESDSRYDSATCFQKTLRRERSLNSRFFSPDVNGGAYFFNSPFLSHCYHFSLHFFNKISQKYWLFTLTPFDELSSAVSRKRWTWEWPLTFPVSFLSNWVDTRSMDALHCDEWSPDEYYQLSSAVITMINMFVPSTLSALCNSRNSITRWAFWLAVNLPSPRRVWTK